MTWIGGVCGELTPGSSGPVLLAVLGAGAPPFLHPQGPRNLVSLALPPGTAPSEMHSLPATFLMGRPSPPLGCMCRGGHRRSLRSSLGLCVEP